MMKKYFNTRKFSNDDFERFANVIKSTGYFPPPSCMLYVLYIVVTCTVHDPILMCVHYYMVRVCVCSCTVKRQSRTGYIDLHGFMLNEKYFIFLVTGPEY